MKHQPTPAQKRVLGFIDRFIVEKGFPPTKSEIAEGLGFRSATAATDHLRLLEKKGLVEMIPGVARGVRRVHPSEPTSETDKPGIPVIGDVAAGRPILARENIESHIDIDPRFFRPKADFFVRVRGDSMIEAGIIPGDFLAITRTRELVDGQITVVRLDDEVTVKRIRRKGSKIILEPANAALRPTTIDPSRVSFAIEGHVVGLLRSPLVR